MNELNEQNPAHAHHTPVFISPCFGPDPEWLKINRRKILRMRNILTFLFRHALGQIPSGQST
jgi:hypothetical protein